MNERKFYEKVKKKSRTDELHHHKIFILVLILILYLKKEQ